MGNVVEVIAAPVLVPVRAVQAVVENKPIVEAVKPTVQAAAVTVAVVAVAVAPVTATVNTVVAVAEGKPVVNVIEKAIPALIPGLATAAVMEAKERLECKCPGDWGKKVLIIDASDPNTVMNAALHATWDFTAALKAIDGRFDKVIRATDWRGAVDELMAYVASAGDKISELHFWGHGSPGYAYVGDHSLGVNALPSDCWTRLTTTNGGVFKVTSNGTRALVWFRTCSSFDQDKGRAFAKAVSDQWGVRVAGHTQTIHALHPGLVTLQYGGSPSWGNGTGESILATDMSPVELAPIYKSAPLTQGLPL